MHHRLDRTLALAGVFQAAALVKQLAWTGKVDQQSFHTSIQSIFRIDASIVSEIYGSVDRLQLGLDTLVSTMRYSTANQDPEIAKYVISLLHLERRLVKKKAMLAHLREGIERAHTQAEHFGITHSNVIANLANLYADTLSTFNFRIHVTGDADYLSHSHQTNKVRALLLAGIRSAVLWRQLEGSRWHLVFQRQTIIKNAQYLLEKYGQTQPEVTS